MNSDNIPSTATAPYQVTTEPFRTGIRGICPRCQKGKIFKSYLKVVKNCGTCGLDYSFTDPADGPAFFAMSIVSPFAIALALWLEVGFEVPFWVHILTTLPFTLGGCLLLLPPLKGWIVSMEYIKMKHKEGGE